MASQNLNADLSSLSIVDVMQLYMELIEIIRLGHTKDSSYGDEGEWTKGGYVVAIDGCF
jgi:hypothetical protein